MSDLQVGMYFICFALVAGASFAFMFKMMTTTLEELNKPVQKTNIHPETVSYTHLRAHET